MPTRDDRAQPPESAPARDARWSGTHWLFLCLLVIAGAWLRVVAASNDLWLDEIWTIIQVKERVQSLFDVFTRLDRENHALYTMWVFLAGPNASDFMFRLPAVVAGIAVIPLVAWVAHLQWRSPVATMFAAAMVTTSYLQVHYGSEARGYAPAIFLALLAYAFLLRGWDGGVWWRVGYGLVLSVGFVAQPLVLSLLMGAGAWTLYDTWRRGGAAKAIRSAAVWQGVPAALFGVYYFAYLRHLRTGGGPHYAPEQIANDAVAYTFGLPVTATVTTLAVCVGSAVLVTGVILLVRARDNSWLFYAVGIVIAPVLLIVTRGSPYLYERYFVLNMALLLLLASRVASWSWSRGTVGRSAALGCLIAMFAGSAYQANGLIRHGRGDYRGVARLIAQQTSTPTVTFAGDDIFRIKLVMDHHFPRAVPGRKYRQVRKEEGPPWLLVHSQVLPMPELPPFADTPHGRYQHVRTFPYARLSGWHSAVYRLVR